MAFERFDRLSNRHIAFQSYQIQRNPGIVNIRQNGFAAFVLFDFPGTGQNPFQRSEFFNQLGGGLEADSGNAGDIADAVAGQSLNINNLIGINAEFSLTSSGVKNLSFMGS